MEITISGNDKKRLEQVKDLAKKLGLYITVSKADTNDSDQCNGEELYKLMEEMAASGAFQSIKDPVAWQWEVRKDKPLCGRED